VYSFNYLVCEV